MKRISIVTGHYGSGKTNISVNMALNLVKSGKKVTIVDLDIVNPYFRTADFKDMLIKNNVNVITPVYANTNLDIPALPAQINSIFDSKDSYVVIDVGGDDAGAIALGRYSNNISKEDYDMYYVINKYRFQTKDENETVELLSEIESCARLKATKLINNSNLGEETTYQTVFNSLDYVEKVSNITKLPVAFTCIKEDINENKDDFISVEIFIKPFYC